MKNLSLRKRKAKPIRVKKTYQSRAAVEAQRTIAKIDRAAVKIVTLVAEKVNHDGELEAYDGIEAARETRAIITKIFADFSRSATFRRMAAK